MTTGDKLFCPEPWEHLEVAAGGDAYVCCSGWIPRIVGNVLREDLRDIWSGQRAHKIRESIDDNSFSECSKCPFLPGPCGPVVRENVTPESSMMRVATGRISLLTLSYDRTCNLVCPSCRRGIEKLDHAREDLVARVTTKILESGALAAVDRMVVAGGGDPFASSAYQDLLHHVPWNDLPELRIRLFTNGLLAGWDRWLALGQARERVDQVSVSLDASTPETYAVNRGGDWFTLYGNLVRFSQMRRSGTLNRFELTFTVQANNFREMPAFVDLARSLGADVVYFGKLQNWGAYTPWDYACRAVHSPSHPDHGRLLEILRDDRFGRPGVVLANFGQDSASRGGG